MQKTSSRAAESASSRTLNLSDGRGALPQDGIPSIGFLPDPHNRSALCNVIIGGSACLAGFSLRRSRLLRSAFYCGQLFGDLIVYTLVHDGSDHLRRPSLPL